MYKTNTLININTKHPVPTPRKYTFSSFTYFQNVTNSKKEKKNIKNNAR